MNFFKTHKNFFIILIIVICILLMVLTAGFKLFPAPMYDAFGFVITPIQQQITNIKDYWAETSASIGNKNYLEEQNEQLKSENEYLKLEVNRLELLDKENKELSSLLETSQKYKQYPTSTARIIGKDPNNWYNTLILDKGTNDGISVDMIVVANGGLVGKIVEVTSNSSKVITIIDDTSSISVTSVRTNDLGFVQGDVTLMNSNLTKLEYLDINSSVLEDDEIVTSSISSLYPAGLTVGYVEEIYSSNEGLTKHAIVQPVVNFKELTSVLIITEIFTDNLGGN